jgi:antitoxin (DNA-binding transcriptional repressor) of toxin-antitoxin stability system
MDSMTAGELKTNFSEVLNRVQAGEIAGVLHGRIKKPVVKMVPISKGFLKERPIGILEGRCKFVIQDDFKIESTEEFLGLE